MLVICFVMSVVLLCNYCVTLCYSATKMSFAEYCIHGKRKGVSSLDEFTGGELVEKVRGKKVQ